MKIMMRVTIPVEKGNQAEADGSLSQIIQDLVEEVKPEAAYFFMEDGERAALLVFEETDAARLTKLNEPLMAKLEASIDHKPVLSLDELIKGL